MRAHQQVRIQSINSRDKKKQEVRTERLVARVIESAKLHLDKHG
jgi:hypothetical protein